MKNFNILGVHWKIWLLGGATKNQYKGGIALKGGFGQFLSLRWGLGKKEGWWCFWGGGWYPNAHYDIWRKLFCHGLEMKVNKSWNLWYVTLNGIYHWSSRIIWFMDFWRNVKCWCLLVTYFYRPSTVFLKSNLSFLILCIYLVDQSAMLLCWILS